MSRKTSFARDTAQSPINAHSMALRAAGLNVTSARLAVLRMAPEVLADEGELTPRKLHAAVRAAGYAVSLSALHNVLARLRSAGLVPATSSTSRASQIASASPAAADVLDDRHAS